MRARGADYGADRSNPARLWTCRNSARRWRWTRTIRFALGQALFRTGTAEAVEESADHLAVANRRDPNHLATYHILGQALIKLGRKDEARSVLARGCEKAESISDGMGRDLGPVMAEMIETLDQ